MNYEAGFKMVLLLAGSLAAAGGVVAFLLFIENEFGSKYAALMGALILGAFAFSLGAFGIPAQK